MPQDKNPDKAVILWVVGAFLFGIVAWGGSMWVLKKNLFRTVNLLMIERERIKSLEAWVKRANELQITYDQAAANSKEVVGKPVVWEVRIASGTLAATYQGDPARPVLWTNPGKVEPGKGKTVGVIRGVERPKTSITLEYLGYQ